MPNTMRWRYGETNPVMLPVLAGQVVEIGDLLYLDGDNVKSAVNIPDQGTEATNQEFLHHNFVGIAMQSTSGLAAGSMRVATTGVFEMNCNAATFEVGDLLAGQENAAGDGLEAQLVVSTNVEYMAIGRCVKPVPVAAGKVLMSMVSTIVHGGPQAPALGPS